MSQRNRRHLRGEENTTIQAPVTPGPHSVSRVPQFSQQQQQAQYYARQRHTEPWNRQNFRNQRPNWGEGNGRQRTNGQQQITHQHQPPNNYRNRPRRQFNNHSQAQMSDNPPSFNSEPALSSISNTTTAPHLHGYVYDENKKKYFKILQDNAGVPGFSRSDITAKRNKERMNAISANRPRFASGSFASRPVINPISRMMRSSECGMKSGMRPERRLFESRLLGVSNVPSSIQKTEIAHLGMGIGTSVGCEFMDVSRNGTTLFGSWAIGANTSHSERMFSQLMAVDVKINEKIAVKSAMEADSDPVGQRLPRNYTGLDFSTSACVHDEFYSNLVEMVTAPVDSDVTCVLYTTAATKYTSRGIQTCCDVYLKPIPELCSEEDSDILSSPIYNIHWGQQNAIWSCAWNANRMRVALGMESTVKIIDVLSEQNFFVSSQKKNVLSQEFEVDGDVLYMGLKAEDAMSVDLRSNQIANRLKRTRNVGYIKLLKERANSMITENFQGELKMWDIRRLDKELLIFGGHRNSHYRLPVFIDHEEKAVFAVGEDGITRGWSLHSGDLLCCVPCPRPVQARTDFPRVVYSDCWGGRSGNAAVVLAVGDDLRVHELTL